MVFILTSSIVWTSMVAAFQESDWKFIEYDKRGILEYDFCLLGDSYADSIW